MTVTITPRVHWPNNDLLLPADLFGVSPPLNLHSFHVRAPKYVDVSTMQSLSRPTTESATGGSLRIVYGRVKADIQLTFSNLSTQWKQVAGPGGRMASHGPGAFQFTGGEVFLDLILNIYILDLVKPAANDEISVKIFAAVYDHELLHVQDALDIGKNWLPPRLRRQTTFSDLLVRRNSFNYGKPSDPIDEVARNFRRYIHDRLDNTARSIWAQEHNRRGGTRDAPSEYRAVQERIDELRARADPD